MKKTAKKYFFILFKIIIALSAYSYIYIKLKDFDFNVNFDSSRLYLLLFAVLLLFDNWGVESLKWKLLINKYENMSLIKSFKSVFAGVTSSVFTPNRVGEFVGRIFFVSDKNKGKAVLSTFVGSYSQILITLSIGTLAFFISDPIYISNIQVNENWINILFAILSVVLLVFYLRISLISNFLVRFSKYKRINNVLNSINLYSTTDLLKLLGLSLLRYFVFSIQFVLIVYFFEIEISFVNILLGLAQFYMVLMIIPTISVAELGIRAVIAINVFNQYINHSSIHANQLTLLSLSISLLWLINIVIPALIGSVLLFLDKSKDVNIEMEQ